MWLINVHTLAVREFLGDSIPQYAILSHVWGQEEVTFQDMQHLDEKVKAKPAFKKIEGICKQARCEQLEWAWVDTCCIDKTSSAELSEAINSMFQWYAKSSVCYAFLADVSDVEGIRKSRWFKRGWTLQELLAPSQVAFYSERWEFLGFKTDVNLECQLLEASAIDDAHWRVLKLFDPRDWSIAQRMSWASRRQTTRVEDVAYCLLGIFDVHMPLLYGEGERAFIRLQEEIIRVSEDRSVFAWTDNDIISESPCGFLARSPANFADSYGIHEIFHNRSTKAGDEPDMVHTVTNRGINIQLTLIPTDPKEPTTFYAFLGHDRYSDAIIVRHVTGSEYVRVHADTLLRSKEMEEKSHYSPWWYVRTTKRVILKQPAPARRSLNLSREGNTTLFIEYSHLAHARIGLSKSTCWATRITKTSFIYTNWTGDPVALQFGGKYATFVLQIYHDGSFMIRTDNFAPLQFSLPEKARETGGAHKAMVDNKWIVTARSTLESSTGGGNIHCIVLHCRPVVPLIDPGDIGVISMILGMLGLSATVRFLYILLRQRKCSKGLRTLAWASSSFLLLAFRKGFEQKLGYGQATAKKDYRAKWPWLEVKKSEEDMVKSK
ncbi:heterokaryon incompatibility protein-domain-containing protein [Xylaria flabelliformis]|nr:heterokaryon incompatibility protein-domain-containing protein [Xylaria flabelliformis]